MPTFKLDGREIPFETGRHDHPAAQRHGHRHPALLLAPGALVAANCRMCLVEIAPPPGQRRDDARHPRVGRREAATTSPARSRSSSPRARWPRAEGMEVIARVERARRRGARDGAGVLAPEPPGRLPDLRSGRRVQAAGLLARAPGHAEAHARRAGAQAEGASSFGPTIVYDAERCIMCTRCVRFCDEVAKDPVLDMRERGNLNEIVVAPGPPARSRLHAHDRARVPGRRAHHAATSASRRASGSSARATSVCQGCATGCNAYLDYDPRYNTAYRHRPRDNMAVNKYWMCDEGMLSYSARTEDRVLERARRRQDGDHRRRARRREDALHQRPERRRIAIVLSAQHSQRGQLGAPRARARLPRRRASSSSGRRHGLRRRHPDARGQEPEHRAA